MRKPAGRQPRVHRSLSVAVLLAPVTAVLLAIPVMATLACLVLAGFSLVQWFAWPEAGWGHLGWFAFGVLMSAAPWVTQNRDNAWAMIGLCALGSGGLWFAWQRLGATGPLACKPTDTLCHIAEGVRLSVGEYAVVVLFGLAGLSLVLGGLRYFFWDRPKA